MPNYPTPGNDVILDTSGDDVIDALAGNDSVTVTTGTDSVAGNTGTDTLIVNYGYRTDPMLGTQPLNNTTQGGYNGWFLDESSFTTWLSYTSIERFVITSGSGNDSLVTGNGNDVVKLGAGHDFVDVGTGINSADGGTGSDGFSANFSGMAAGVYIDLRRPLNEGAFGSYANFENFWTIIGSSKNDTFITARLFYDETIESGAGDDRIAVLQGNDTVKGGSGTDTLVIDYSDVDNRVNTVTLNANAAQGGYDGEFTDASFSRVNFTSIERFEIIGGTDSDNVQTGAGNDLFLLGDGWDSAWGGGGNDIFEGGAGNDQLYGEAGNDRLDGGADIDTLTGGAGGDVYIVDNSADTVIELSGGGTDTVESSATFTLSGNVENLRLTGTSAIDGTGNGSANSIVGNSAVNVLNGGAGNDVLNGGAGADTMSGGTDHDTYVVDNVGDKVIENGSSGTDTVQSSVNYGLPTHFEKLVLTGTAGIDGRGNSGDNSVTGNSGANLLNGGSGNDSVDGGAGNDQVYGSLGNDSLKGGTGLDRFLFNTALGATNVDKILDFSTTDDLVYLARYVFTKAGANGILNAAAFRQGSAAADASDRIVYDQATGKIFYDSDGSGAAAQILFATVTAGTALTNADFIVYG